MPTEKLVEFVLDRSYLGRMKVPARLEAVMAVYYQCRPRLRNPRTAAGMCMYVSSDFIKLLHQLQIAADILDFDCDDARPMPRCYPRIYDDWRPPHPNMHLGHTVVRVGRLVVDWTARQYDADLPVPFVWPLRAMHRQWARMPRLNHAGSPVRL